MDAGAEVIVSGHVHQSAIAERREFEVIGPSDRPPHGTTVITAPGLGQPRPNRRGEARGLHVIEASSDSLRVVTYAWATGAEPGEGRWDRIADRRFPRGPRPLAELG